MGGGYLMANPIITTQDAPIEQVMNAILQTIPWEQIKEAGEKITGFDVKEGQRGVLGRVSDKIVKLVAEHDGVDLELEENKSLLSFCRVVVGILKVMELNFEKAVEEAMMAQQAQQPGSSLYVPNGAI